jgi:dTDP-4-dehydrorhamnose reductase
VDGCERQRDLAFSTNALGPELLARAAGARRALLVHVSTDFVFDGAKGSPYTEQDTPHPLNVYGESKLAGEEAVRRFAGEHLIVRTAWLYGRHRGNFTETILALADSRKELRVVTDQRGSPTWTVPLAEAIVALMRAGARGTYHAAGRGECSRYEWAVEILRLAGREVSLVPATTAEFPRPARRPPYSALASEKLSRDTGFRFPPWQQSLGEYLRSRQAG